MRLLHLLPFLLLPALAACGGDAAPTFDDPAAARAAAEKARQNGQTEVAEAGFRHAADHGEGRDRYAALLGLGEILAPSRPDEAQAAFARLPQDCAELWNAEGAQRVIQAWIDAGLLDRAFAALAEATQAFPDDRELFTAQADQIRAKQAGASEDLSGLGYVGD